MSFIQVIPIILLLVQLSLAANLDVISIENPFKNSRHCQKIKVQKGSKFDALRDHLLENGCSYPEFKQNYLEIPSDFSEIDGYPFIEEVHPICSKDEHLLLRICFSKNPTRLFGRPQMVRFDFSYGIRQIQKFQFQFETSDGTLYQFAISDRYLSTSTCLISGTFGRCTAKQTSIVFEIRKKFENAPIESTVAGSIPWTLLGVAATVIFFFSLMLIGFLWYRRTRRLEPKEQKMFIVHSRMPSIHVPDVPHNTGIPFIDDDDALVFEI
ncbi:hypothetical protein CAEBREN_18120 [Caenorhabditis brenneri]|uniref:Uncharacterized protein n=1 Tax=Caenorhabditis brenneri TaxID=135651 RepID=G0NTE4_CAEBE|nr:hypothetical protein CAEBREN_18120 [Caenorhabditis brenneri]